MICQGKLKWDHDMVSKYAKLLGVVIDQKCKSHFYGKGGLLSSLNQRLFMVKKISNHIFKNKQHKVVDGLWTFQLRYKQN